MGHNKRCVEQSRAVASLATPTQPLRSGEAGCRRWADKPGCHDESTDSHTARRRNTADTICSTPRIDQFSTFNLEPRLIDTSRDDERVPLTDTLPPNLTQLDVVDHRTDPSKIARLDSELRELMSSPRFEDLEIIRFWRVREPKNLVVSIDRKAQREQGCWEVSRRI